MLKLQDKDSSTTLTLTADQYCHAALFLSRPNFHTARDKSTAS